MRSVLVLLLKLFGLSAVFIVSTAIGFGVLFGASLDMAPAAGAAFRHQYQWAPLVASLLTLLLYAKVAFREKPRALNGIDILERVDQERRAQPGSPGQQLLRACRLDPVRHPDSSWLVYADPQIGEVHYDDRFGRYRHVPVVGDAQVYSDLPLLLKKINAILITPRPARKRAA
jgi:hypothetical protein